MPLWDFQLPADILSRDEKDTIAKKVTKIYTDLGFPAFWINVFFHENPVGGYYGGGKAPAKAAFFVISHAARSFKSEDEQVQFHESINAIVRPVFEPKNLKWEYNIRESPSDNWRINGMVPPVHKPEILQQWVEQDAPVPY